MRRIKISISHSLDRINSFLDRYVLPWPVRFLTFRFVILATIGLLIPLIVLANNTVLVLGLNSYLNTMSVAVSSIVLLYATISEAHQRQIADMQEKRAQEDHEHVTEMHRLVLETLENQGEELKALKQMVATLQGIPYESHGAIPKPNLQELHPRGKIRFQEGDRQKRLNASLYHNELISTIREEMESKSD